VSKALLGSSISTSPCPPLPGVRRGEGTKRRGLSLVEVLVVIAIVAILIGLLFAAVQQSRAAAQRTQCQNNLKQIGLALHGYHGVSERFPPGVSVQADAGAYPFMSWNTRVLPFLEQEQLWTNAVQAYAQDSNFLDNPPHSNLGRALKAFACPADPRTLEPQRLRTGLQVAFTDYLGVEGTNQYFQDGMLFLDSRIRISDVRDGTSNTLLIGERPASADGALGWWYAGEGQSKDGSADMLLGACELNLFVYGRGCALGPFPFGPGQLDNQCDAFHFWSMHSGGAHFLFVDGSVHFLHYSSAPLLPVLATRAGGEDVSSWE
jgi:prepilin-type N-terminal cleavage/methylation domain-containing protein/prepilin-type processing-associated H-X9-DG protein